MNFFQRRAILKKANLLELTPLCNHKEEISDDGMVTILIPKFSNKFALKYIAPKLKSDVIKIKLDEFGSETWKAIDGKRNVYKIGEHLTNKFGEKIQPVYERLAKFFLMLYEQKIITYQEINK